LAAGKVAAAGCLSAGAVKLAEEVVAGMVGAKVMKMVLVCVALGLALSGAGVAGYGWMPGVGQPAKVVDGPMPQGKGERAQGRTKQQEPENQGVLLAPDFFAFGDGAFSRIWAAWDRHVGILA